MSWQDLINVTKEARKLRQEEREKPIVECPNDGTILDKHPITGVLNCPMGDYRVPGGATKGRQ